MWVGKNVISNRLQKLIWYFFLSIIHTAQIDEPEEPPTANVTEINSTDTDDAGPTRLPSKVNL